MKLLPKFRLADRFNRPDCVVVIASFPGRTDRSIKDIDAVASYTDHFTKFFRKTLARRGREVVILAQKIGSEESWYVENGMLVARVWDKGSPGAFLQIIKTMLLFFRNIRTVLVQFEFHQFGGITTTALFPAFLIALRLINRHVTLVMHQVVEDITTLTGHVNIPKGSLKAGIFNAALRSFYIVTSKIAQTLVVHNTYLASRFTRMTGRSDVIVIPHGLGAIKGRMSKSQARKLMGYKPDDTVILSFGFLTWYKGSDWLVRQFAKNNNLSSYNLLMAGGESPNLKDQPHYQSYASHIQHDAGKKSNIRLTGFIEDGDIPAVFAAADLVILPYRTLISSSGPLAMTIAFEKPFIMSKNLKPYLSDPDFACAVAESGSTEDILTFSLSPRTLKQSISRALLNKQSLIKLSQTLKTSRKWDVVAEKFAHILPAADYTAEKKFAIMGKDYSFSYARS